MTVSYTGPLRRAWARAQRILFRPFRIEIWLVLGFAAFLSEALTTGRGAGFSWHGHPGALPGRMLHGVGGLASGALWTGLGLVILSAVLVLAILLVWVNSRGRFIFLDDVVRERIAIVEPWQRFARLGNSLFFWSIGFGLACAAVAVVIALPFIASLAALWSDGRFHWGALGALWTLLAVALPFAIVASYVVLVLSDFVIPIMYRHDIGVTGAWSRFLALFRAHPGSFLLYGLFVFILWLVVLSVLTVVGFASCCVGFVLLGLPYVSSVVLLPLLVTFRALGPEFLAQFGPDHSVFADAGGPAGAAAGPSGAVSTPAGAPPAPGGGAGA
jgi:hypothetical protein